MVAGAGSGKTRVLTARVARLLEEGTSPWRVLAVTFTNKASDEMRSRIESLSGPAARSVWMGTFHSFGARLLRAWARAEGRSPSFSIYDEQDSMRTIKEAMKRADLSTEQWSPGAIRSRISKWKNELRDPAEAVRDNPTPINEVTARAYQVYQSMLRDRNAVDFDDLLVEPVLALESDSDLAQRWAERFLHVLVDEYQDTNHAQYRIVKALARARGNICVVGDEDQAIYGWRGADVRNILAFDVDFPGARAVSLEQNYRSRDNILGVANAVIRHNRQRREKALRSVRGPGAKVRVEAYDSDRAEARAVADSVQRAIATGARPADHAVLYRINSQSRVFEEAFRERRVPCRVIGGQPFYERREVKDALAYARLVVNESDDDAFQRAVRWPRRGVGLKTIAMVAEVASKQSQPLLSAARQVCAGRGGAGRRIPKGLREFVWGLDELRVEVPSCTAREALERTASVFAFAEALLREEGGDDRLANLAELVAAASVFDPAESRALDGGLPGVAEDTPEQHQGVVAGTVVGEGPTVIPDDLAQSDLGYFLQTAALTTNLDEADFGEDVVALMTLHAAKGLEFKTVFLAGLEEGLFPLIRDEDDDLEEERRLFYVGATRAMDHLHLSYAQRRWRFGEMTFSDPSRFFSELPRDRVETGMARTSGSARDRRRRTRQARRVTTPTPTSWQGRAVGGTARQRPSTDRPAATAQAGGISYDYSESQETLRFKAGERVSHPTFGEGEIVSVEVTGHTVFVEIDFDEGGRKTVSPRHARLAPA